MVRRSVTCTGCRKQTYMFWPWYFTGRTRGVAVTAASTALSITVSEKSEVVEIDDTPEADRGKLLQGLACADEFDALLAAAVPAVHEPKDGDGTS